jgi:hypothetical protein
MSRGPGRWQRALLDDLDGHDLGAVGTLVHNHLGRPPTRSEMVAARRAARRLAEDGLVQALHLAECRSCGALSEIWICPQHCPGGCAQTLVIARPDMTGISSVMPLNGLPRWVSVALGPSAAGATLTAETRANV